MRSFKSCRFQHLIYRIGLVLLLSSGHQPAFAQSANVADTIAPLTQQELTRLDAIAVEISRKTNQRNELRQQINEGGSPELQQRLTAFNSDIDTLKTSFELIVLDELSIELQDQPAEQPLDWKQELTDVAAPLLDSLKSLTKRPRQLASLRSELTFYQQKLAIADQAISTTNAVPSTGLADESTAHLIELANKWQSARNLFESRLLAVQSQLENLESEDTAGWQGIWPTLKAFALGRGLTLILSGIAALITWSIMRGLWWLYNNRLTTRTHRRQSTRYRLLAYSYHLVTVLVVIAAVLLVLYIREDLLLLALAFITIAGAALSLRTFLPRFFKEARLLLNLGAVREDESLMVNGLPWQVMSLNIQTVLKNPALDGIMRLPLEAIAPLVSRPINDDLWFPTQRDDYLFLPDGRFAQVTRQTSELVDLSVRGGMRMTYRAADFYAMNITNLSRGDSFGVAVSFGLDYALQAISLSTVPAALKDDISNAFAAEGMLDDIENIMVEFQSAGASSLDYIIYVTANSRIANRYYKVERVVQQSCVATANKQNWNIPFPQMTIHQPTG